MQSVLIQLLHSVKLFQSSTKREVSSFRSSLSLRLQFATSYRAITSAYLPQHVGAHDGAQTGAGGGGGAQHAGGHTVGHTGAGGGA